ncbi:MAG: T9SS type A sorting domain-containing protein [Flavobacteriales bacterium]|nr:T9SS type A sorting domain-containing protein [Flavobacteriales bacterium]
MAEITGAVFVYAEGPVFVSSHDRSDLRLYPNPCTERVHIRAETDNLVRIRMVDSVGREVRPWEITTGNTFSWNVVDVEPGSYIVQCELASGKRVTLPLARQ